MNTFIEQLKQVSVKKQIELSSERESGEKVAAQSPCIVCAITMGKELHAGHLFLLAMADQVRSSVGAKHFLIINNNTGPRAAGALCAVAERAKTSLAKAASQLNSGQLSPGEVMTAYRSRRQNVSNLFEAMQILSSGEFDIFASVRKLNQKVLTDSGFDVEIISESDLLRGSLNKIASVTPAWADSGFMAYSSDKRLALLEKGGQLTASGSVFSSLSELRERLGADLFLLVDSLPDSIDAAFVFSALSKDSRATQVPGMGVGFNGKIASGTNGEAWTIKQLSKKFAVLRPGRELRQAAKFLTLTLPMSFPSVGQTGSPESFFDFKDNESLLAALVECSDEAISFNATAENVLANLASKIQAGLPTGDKGASELLRFLPQRLTSLRKTPVSELISRLRKSSPLKTTGEINDALEKMGYSSAKDLAKERTLAQRNNFHFSHLEALLKKVELIGSLTASEAMQISEMIRLCQEKIDT